MIDCVPRQPRHLLWSVMIPTYNPREDQLAEALRSVLAQLGPTPHAQIEIVDDASDCFEPSRFVGERGLHGVRIHRQARRLGMVGNWNACVRRARGRFVHLLHQDDFVLPGFYAAMRKGLQDRGRERAGAAFCASLFLEADGRVVNRTTIAQREPGLLADWHEHVFTRLQIQTPAVVVRREVYEQLGGFDDHFAYASDWDMWKRIAAHHPIWYEPRSLACYRRHANSQTARLRRSAATIVDLGRSIARSQRLLPPAVATRVTKRARTGYTLFAVEEATALLRSRGGLRVRLGNLRAAGSHLSAARRLGSTADLVLALVTVARRVVTRVRRRCCLRVAPESD